MDKELFYKRLREEFVFKEGESLDAGASFKAHRNWSSITSLLVISMFYSDYQVHITAAELVACETFEDLYRLVMEKAESLCTA